MPVSYASDIRPKFRAKDIGCMKGRGIRLDDAAWMQSADANFGFPDHGNARHVFDYLSGGSMPPDGAWPPDWLKAYSDWMDGGFQP